MAHPQRRGGARSGGESGAPVLFLDVDGVLNVATATHAGAFSPLHSTLLARLARVVRRSRAPVVLSSSWRHDRQRLALLERAWRAAQLPPWSDATPTLATAAGLITSVATGVNQSGRSVDTHSRQRVLEIQQWLRERGGGRAVRWAAVDDLDLAAAATGASDQARFVRTDPARGLSVDDVETLVGLLTEQEEEDQDEAPVPPLSREANLLRLDVDLIAVASHAGATAVVIVDTVDFSVAARLDTTRQPLRAWLRTQEAEFSLDRLATVCLHDPQDARNERSLGPLDVSFPSELTPEAFASTLAVGAFHNASREAAETSRAAIELLLKAAESRDGAEWCGTEVATRQLRDAGLSADAATHLATDTALVARLLDVLPTLAPLLSPQRASLAVELCRLFPSASSRVARRALAEYVARGEITSRAALEAVRLMWTAQQQHPIALEELDEMVAML